MLAVAAPPLARVALKFGPAEYFSLVLLGLIVSIALARGSTLKALAMIVLGLLLGTVGQDIYTGTPRFTFGQRELYGGIDFVSVAVGMFGVAEILRNLENEKTRTAVVSKVTQPLADPRGPAPDRRPDRCAAPASAPRSASCPAAATCWRRSPRTRSRSGSRSGRRSSGTARSRASPAPSRRTTPPRRRRSSRCSPWACPRTR